MAKREISYPQTAGSVAFNAWILTNGFTNEEAGDRCGVTGVTAYHWRIGAKVPQPPNRRAIEMATRGRDGRRVTPGIPCEAWEQDPAVTAAAA